MFTFMRNQRILLFGVIILITALCLWFLMVFEIEPPKLSHASGFYESEFQLTLTAPQNAEIYYTLDGSTPDQNSLHYTGPICVSNRTESQNVYSMRTDTSAGFRTDLIQEFQPEDGDPKYMPPDYLLDKCTIIRAISINRVGMESEIASASFFVGISPDTYSGCNIISIISDPDNLFSPETGIYVTGNLFEDYLLQGYMNSNWRFWEANYRQRGSEWERPVTMHIFDKDGQFQLSKEGGIRIHGGVSRGTLPRGLNLYAREQYDRTNTFGYCFFGNDYDPHAVTLNSGGNQLITQFNDYMMTQRVRYRNMATMQFAPYVLFLDGEYWGFYWLSEKFDEEYIQFYYDVDPENCIIIKVHEVEVGKDSDYTLYMEMESFISSNDMSIPENYEKACEMIDMDSFLDYYATMIYIARTEDWPYGNWAAWRSRTQGSGPYADTKWRWMLFDCNSTSMSTYLGFDMTTYNSLEEISNVDSLFSSLWKNESFREDFQARIFEIADECFDAKEMDQFIREYATTMEPVMEKSWARFYGSQNNKREEYYQTLENIRQFFMNRRAYVETWFPEAD